MEQLPAVGTVASLDQATNTENHVVSVGVTAQDIDSGGVDTSYTRKQMENVIREVSSSNCAVCYCRSLLLLFLFLLGEKEVEVEIPQQVEGVAGEVQ